jgi:thiol-disulfide isomerase/thioredoxin
MKILRTILAILLTFGICLAIFRSDNIIQYGIVELSWGWMNSYLFPKGLLFVFTAVLAWAIWPVFYSWKRIRFLGILLIFGVTIGGYLIINTPYIEWIKEGTDMTDKLSGNPVEEYLNENQPGFDGVICLALPGCPHCEVAIPKLALMQKRVPELDVIVFVFTEDSSKAQSFQKDTGVDELPFHAVPDPNSSIKLCEGKFPTFLYLKNGKVVHRWFNWQFGYPAYDWVESDLE